MRKVRVFLVMAVLLSALSVGAFAFQNEPEGFRGLKWGDPPTEEMECYRSSDETNYYTLPQDKMAIGNVKLYAIGYTFYENQFLMVALYFKGKDNYDLMKMICEERYGKDKIDEGYWAGQKGCVILEYDSIEEKGYLILGNSILMMKRIEANKKKESEKAADDF